MRTTPVEGQLRDGLSFSICHSLLVHVHGVYCVRGFYSSNWILKEPQNTWEDERHHDIQSQAFGWDWWHALKLCYHVASGINVLHTVCNSPTVHAFNSLLEVWEKPLCWVGNPSTKVALSIQELQILLSVNRRVLGWLLMHSGWYLIKALIYVKSSHTALRTRSDVSW